MRITYLKIINKVKTFVSDGIDLSLENSLNIFHNKWTSQDWAEILKNEKDGIFLLDFIFQKTKNMSFDEQLKWSIETSFPDVYLPLNPYNNNCHYEFLWNHFDYPKIFKYAHFFTQPLIKSMIENNVFPKETSHFFFLILNNAPIDILKYIDKTINLSFNAIYSNLINKICNNRKSTSSKITSIYPLFELFCSKILNEENKECDFRDITLDIFLYEKRIELNKCIVLFNKIFQKVSPLISQKQNNFQILWENTVDYKSIYYHKKIINELNELEIFNKYAYQFYHENKFDIHNLNKDEMVINDNFFFKIWNTYIKYMEKEDWENYTKHIFDQKSLCHDVHQYLINHRDYQQIYEKKMLSYMLHSIEETKENISLKKI